MKIIINSRKYKLPTQFEMLDIGLDDRFETEAEAFAAIKKLDELAQKYINKLNQCCDDFPNCSHTQKVGKDKVPF